MLKSNKRVSIVIHDIPLTTNKLRIRANNGDEWAISDRNLGWTRPAEGRLRSPFFVCSPLVNAGAMR